MTSGPHSLHLRGYAVADRMRRDLKLARRKVAHEARMASGWEQAAEAHRRQLAHVGALWAGEQRRRVELEERVAFLEDRLAEYAAWSRGAR